jgi:hypothetical protein
MQPRPRKLSAFTLSTAMAFGAAAVLAIGLPTPVAAQQTSGRDAWQAGESVVQAHNKASQAKDAAGVAALYAGDAIMVTPDGPLVGRAAIEKYYAESFKVVYPRVGQARSGGNGRGCGEIADRDLGGRISKSEWADTGEGLLDNHRCA